MIFATRTALAVAVGAAAMLALSACVPNRTGAETATTAAAISVKSSATKCSVSDSTAPSGAVNFTVTNTADQVTEFYLLASDGKRIISEAENVAPGAPRVLTVQLKAGTYFTQCKPGMTGDGVGRAAFTVTESGAKVGAAAGIVRQRETAVTNYIRYLRAQVAVLGPATATLLDAYRAGDDAKARSLYATTRASYETLEPVAESFGDLDRKIDLRQADVAAGDTWTGWHRIEKDLWPPLAAANGGLPYVALTPAERQHVADLLRTHTTRLCDEVNAKDFSVTIDAIGNGAIELMDEVAVGKITGEEEIWSHTDLWDFQANLDGAHSAFESVESIALARNPKLVAEIDRQFGALKKQLAGFGSLSTGFPYYNDLSPAQVKQLADGVNALSEPLSKLTAAIVSPQTP